jgi:hypothetical protein
MRRYALPQQTKRKLSFWSERILLPLETKLLNIFVGKVACKFAIFLDFYIFTSLEDKRVNKLPL